MQISLTKKDLMDYTSKQLNTFFPDKKTVNLNKQEILIDLALDRIHNCFKHVSFNHYNDMGNTKLNHLYSDQYLMYLWFLSNTIWKETNDALLASKLYYLNKSLHGFDCMYDTKLPNIFLIIHGCGTMLGKASYSDYLMVAQGCTIGSNNGDYPEIGRGVAVASNSSIIGKCKINDRATISTRTIIMDRNLDSDTVGFINLDTGRLEMKKSKECYAQRCYIDDLKNIN